MCVCVKRLDRRKTPLFFNGRGSPGFRGGRWSTKTPPRDPCKRTCGTLVLGAFKSQLVATIVHIYLYIYLSLSLPLSLSLFSSCMLMGFSSRRITPMIQFLSSVCLPLFTIYLLEISGWTNYRFTTGPPHRNWSTCWCPRWPWSWRGATARSQEMVVAPGKNVIQWYISGFNRDILGYN